MKLSLFSQPLSHHQSHPSVPKPLDKQLINLTTPAKKDTARPIARSKQTDKKLILTQFKHPFHSALHSNRSLSSHQPSQQHHANHYVADSIPSSTPIKEILNSQKPLPKSPFNKNCLHSKSSKTLTLNRFNKNPHQNTTSTKNLNRSFELNHHSLELNHHSLELNQSTSPKKALLSSRDSRQLSIIDDPTRSIKPTHYTSVKLFMSSKFKKGRKQKLPVNILAFAQTIHEKETTDSVLSSSCVRNLKFEDTIVVKDELRDEVLDFKLRDEVPKFKYTESVPNFNYVGSVGKFKLTESVSNLNYAESLSNWKWSDRAGDFRVPKYE